MGELGEFRNYLLRRTLKYAVERVPFYRNLRLPRKWSGKELARFPIIDRDVVGANLSRFLVLDRFPDFVVTSGGTSGGSPNVTYRNTEEYEAAHHYLSGIDPKRQPALETIPGFTLDIFFNSHGYYWRKPNGSPMVSMTLEQPAHAQFIERLLVSGLALGDRSIPLHRIQCQNAPLRALTAYFVATGVSAQPSTLQSLLVYGAHISRIWRSRLEAFWGVPVQTRYGLAEFATGGAQQCAACENYHFWTAWPEFLSLSSSNEVDRGDARLVLTSLVPFCTTQPRIRYDTGDLVTVKGYCQAAGQLGFRFRGRSSSSLITDDSGESRVLVSEVDILEVLDRLDDVAPRPHALIQQLWSPGTAASPFQVGAPSFRIKVPIVTGKRRSLRIEIEVLFDPATSRARARRFRDRFAAELGTEAAGILSELSNRRLSLDIALFARGSLGGHFKTTA